MLKQQGQQNLVTILLNNTIHFFFQCGNAKIIPISLVHIILQNGE